VKRWNRRGRWSRAWWGRVWSTFASDRAARGQLAGAVLVTPLLVFLGLGGGCGGAHPGVGDGGTEGRDGDGPPRDSHAGDAPGLDGSVDVDGSTGGPDGGLPEERLARLVELCHEWGDIVCDAQQRCCAEDERADPDAAACRNRYATGCDLLLQGEAFTDGRISIDVRAAELSNARMRMLAADCDPDAGSGPEKLIQGRVAVGGDCTPVDPFPGVGRDASALLSCVPGSYCDLSMVDGSLHGVCRTLGMAGDSCSSTAQCDPAADLTCDEALGGVCGARHPDGAVCSDWTSCAGGYCDHRVCSSTPHPRWCNM